ncbi:MAG: ethylbenzene dehydrogenase-related protein [Alphaproteobacteria bacterium]
MKSVAKAAILGTLLAASPALAQPPEGTLAVPVQRLAAAPKVDGDLTDWATAKWTKVKIQPADDKVESKAVGDSEVELAVGVHGDMVYVAARWPDSQADTTYRPWKVVGSKYKRSEDRDDGFAIRFHMDGEYDRCMISEKIYKVDVWTWSAGRTDPLGIADDYHHVISTNPIDESAEYKNPSGSTTYIKKIRDEGTPSWENTKAPKEVGEPTLPGVSTATTPSGSAADVAAKGRWADGKWSLEMARKLDTVHPDEDAVLSGGKAVQGAVAVFNHSHSENKSVSGFLTFDFSAVK